MNSLPRWLISITDMPEPCQSSISAAACDSTSSGSAAGPALKLNTLLTGRLPTVAACVVPAAVLGRLPVHHAFRRLGDALDARELRALVEVDQHHALGRAPHLADLVNAGADEHAAGGDEHDF